MKGLRIVSRRPGIKGHVASQQKWKCNKCKLSLPYPFDLDHIIPLNAGGSDEVSNLQALCAKCHREKTGSEMQVYYDQLEEEKSGQSKYWNRKAFSFIANKNFSFDPSRGPKFQTGKS